MTKSATNFGLTSLLIKQSDAYQASMARNSANAFKKTPQTAAPSPTASAPRGAHYGTTNVLNSQGRYQPEPAGAAPKPMMAAAPLPSAAAPVPTTAPQQNVAQLGASAQAQGAPSVAANASAAAAPQAMRIGENTVTDSDQKAFTRAYGSPYNHGNSDNQTQMNYLWGDKYNASVNGGKVDPNVALGRPAQSAKPDQNAMAKPDQNSVAMFQKYHGGKFDPNSAMDISKMQNLMAAQSGGSAAMYAASNVPYTKAASNFELVKYALNMAGAWNAVKGFGSKAMHGAADLFGAVPASEGGITSKLNGLFGRVANNKTVKSVTNHIGENKGLYGLTSGMLAGDVAGHHRGYNEGDQAGQQQGHADGALWANQALRAGAQQGIQMGSGFAHKQMDNQGVLDRIKGVFTGNSGALDQEPNWMQRNAQM